MLTKKKPFLLCLFLLVFFGLKAQKGIDFEQILKLENQSARFDQLLEEVENITQISFSYSSSTIQPGSIIYLPKKQISFNEFLSVLQEQLNVEYLEFNNKILFIPIAYEEKEFWIDGYVRDATSGESIIGATVYNSSRNYVSLTNEFGYYSLKVTSSNELVRISFLGYTPEIITGFSEKKKRIDLSLKPAFTLPNIVITPSDSLSSVRQINKEIEASLLISNPGLLGENNILQSMKFLPEIQSGGEVQGNILVQGGGPDQNLILMDGVPIYEVNHLLGLTSIFSNEAVNSVDIETSGFSAQYGGRLSSVINVKTKNGNKFKHQARVSTGLLGASVHVEGPIAKTKTSYLVSARTSYINQILEPVAKNYFDVLSTNFGYSDINIKLHHNLTKNSSLSLGGFLGNDNLGFDNQIFASTEQENIRAITRNSIKWQNEMFNIKYNQVVNEKLVFTITASTVGYDLRSRSSNELITTSADTSITNELDVFAISLIDDNNLRTDWTYKTSENHSISFGGGLSNHVFSPSIISRDSINVNFNPALINGIFANEYFLYLEDKINFSEFIQITGGFHLSRFLAEENDFNSFQPRMALDIFFSENTDLNLSYSQMTQFIHLLVNPGTGLPADLWLPSTDKIRPEESIHYNAKVRHKWNKNFMSSISGYYKTYENLIDYTSASPLFNPIVTQATFIPIINNARDWEDRVEVGSGVSYGVNFFNSYISSKFRTTFSYAYGVSNRQFDNINKGEPFPFKYDRRHDVSILFQYNLNENWTCGFNWIYGSGQATTFATTQFLSIEGEPILDFSQRNNFRMPDYHRLDLTASYNRQIAENIGMSVDVGCYNTYNRLNPYFVYLVNDEDANQFDARQIGIFPFLPFVNLKFSYN